MGLIGWTITVYSNDREFPDKRAGLHGHLSITGEKIVFHNHDIRGIHEHGGLILPPGTVVVLPGSEEAYDPDPDIIESDALGVEI